LGFVNVDADFIINFTQAPIAAGGDVLELASAAFVGLTPGQNSIFSARLNAANKNTTVLVDTGANIAMATGANARSNVRSRLCHHTWRALGGRRMALRC
jgi:hypothetical protein